MKSYTFDTNCIIDMAQNTPPARFILDIIRAHRDGQVSAAFVAVSASERQRSDCFLPTYEHFLGRLRALGVADIPQIKGMAYWDISYWDHALSPSENDKLRERHIHDVLFPNIEFNFADFIRTVGIDSTDTLSRKARKWRNAWCDRQMIWAHDFHSRDVFVTSDQNFKKLVGRVGFETIAVCTPEEAAKALN